MTVSYTLCVCTVFDENAKKIKDAYQIVQDRAHHLHDLSGNCLKQVILSYFCMYTTAETREQVSGGVDGRLCR